MIKIKKVFKILAYCYVFTGLLQSCQKKTPPNGADNPITSAVDTSLELTTASQSAVIDAQVTFSATLKPSESLSGNLPTGDMTFYQDGETITNCKSVPINESLTATCTTQFNRVGTYNISVTYRGDELYRESASAELTMIVQAIKTYTSLTITPSNPILGEKLTLSSSTFLDSEKTKNVSQGNVNFYVNGQPECTPQSINTATNIATCEYPLSDGKDKKFEVTYSDSAGTYGTSTDEFKLNNIAKRNIRFVNFAVKWAEEKFNKRTVDITLTLKDPQTPQSPIKIDGKVSFFYDSEATSPIKCDTSTSDSDKSVEVKYDDKSGLDTVTCRFTIPFSSSPSSEQTFYAQYDGGNNYNKPQMWSQIFTTGNVGYDLTTVSLKAQPGILDLDKVNPECTPSDAGARCFNYEVHYDKIPETGLSLMIQAAGIWQGANITEKNDLTLSVESKSAANYLLFSKDESLSDKENHHCTDANSATINEKTDEDTLQISCSFSPIVEKIFLKFILTDPSNPSIKSTTEVYIKVKPPSGTTENLSEQGCGLYGNLNKRLFDCAMRIQNSAWVFNSDDHKKTLSRHDPSVENSDKAWFLLACKAQKSASFANCAFLSPVIDKKSPLNSEVHPYFGENDACTNRKNETPETTTGDQTNGTCYFDSKKNILLKDYSDLEKFVRFVVDAEQTNIGDFCKANSDQTGGSGCNVYDGKAEPQIRFIKYNMEDSNTPDWSKTVAPAVYFPDPNVAALPGSSCTPNTTLWEKNPPKFLWQVPSYPMLYMLTGEDGGRILNGGDYKVCDREKPWTGPFCDNTYGFNANAITGFSTTLLWSSSYADNIKHIDKDEKETNKHLGWAYRNGYMIGLPVDDTGALRCMAIVDRKGKTLDETPQK